jgi:hypothetical protein
MRLTVKHQRQFPLNWDSIAQDKYCVVVAGHGEAYAYESIPAWRDILGRSDWTPDDRTGFIAQLSPADAGVWFRPADQETMRVLEEAEGLLQNITIPEIGHILSSNVSVEHYGSDFSVGRNPIITMNRGKLVPWDMNRSLWRFICQFLTRDRLSLDMRDRLIGMFMDAFRYEPSTVDDILVTFNNSSRQRLASFEKAAMQSGAPKGQSRLHVNLLVFESRTRKVLSEGSGVWAETAEFLVTSAVFATAMRGRISEEEYALQVECLGTLRTIAYQEDTDLFLGVPGREW